MAYRARSMINDAIERFETGHAAEEARRAVDLLAAGKLEQLDQVEVLEGETNPDVAYARCWGAVLEGNELAERARQSPERADELFALAGQKYEAALRDQTGHAGGVLQLGRRARRPGKDEDRSPRRTGSSRSPARNTKQHSRSNRTCTTRSTPGVSRSPARQGRRPGRRRTGSSRSPAGNTKQHSPSNPTRTTHSSTGAPRSPAKRGRRPGRRLTGSSPSPAGNTKQHSPSNPTTTRSTTGVPLYSPGRR